MQVKAINVFLNPSKQRRGWVCRRTDGLFQYATEKLIEETDECLEYWQNEYPPSGIFDSEDDAMDSLVTAFGRLERLEGVGSIEFDMSVGPYPDPVANGDTADS